MYNKSISKMTTKNQQIETSPMKYLQSLKNVKKIISTLKQDNQHPHFSIPTIQKNFCGKV